MRGVYFHSIFLQLHLLIFPVTLFYFVLTYFYDRDIYHLVVYIITTWLESYLGTFDF